MAFDDDHGPWIQTFTGKRFHLFDPSPDEVCIEDIAHALSNICRFGGHCLTHLSVAEHSVTVSRHVRPSLALPALLHDAPEAYIGDIVTPLKQAFYARGGLGLMERSILDAIHAALRVAQPDIEERREIKRADVSAYLAEKRDLFAHPAEEPQYGDCIADTEKVVPLPPGEACNLFLTRFRELTKGSALG